jgi:glutamyl-tRNA synthetase
MDDLVIARADGTPLYNLAVAVDDLDLAITEVIRGNDHLTNTAKQLLIIDALGATPPRYGHLPLLHGPDGKKLSKRHGAASVQELRSAGYLPAAVRNYLALLGWGAGDDETILSTTELVRRFDIARVQRNPAQFDETKLRWLNGRYKRELTLEDLTAALEAFYGRTGLAPAVAISSEKLQTLADFWPLCGFIYDGPVEDPQARERWLDEEGLAALAQARAALAAVVVFDVEGIEAALGAVVERRGGKPRDVYQPLRVALAGRPISPGIFETVAVLGREETLARIDSALNL